MDSPVKYLGRLNIRNLPSTRKVSLKYGSFFNGLNLKSMLKHKFND